MSQEVELLGGPRDGEMTEMRRFFGFREKGRWHLYELPDDGSRDAKHVGVLDESFVNAQGLSEGA